MTITEAEVDLCTCHVEHPVTFSMRPSSRLDNKQVHTLFVKHLNDKKAEPSQMAELVARSLQSRLRVRTLHA